MNTTTMRIAVMLLGVLIFKSASAQQGDDLQRLGWVPLPDGLFLVWNLDNDQVRRLHAIEEDYNSERAKLVSEMALSDKDRDACLRTMAGSRRKEVQDVLKAERYDDWMARWRTQQR